MVVGDAQRRLARYRGVAWLMLGDILLSQERKASALTVGQAFTLLSSSVLVACEFDVAAERFLDMHIP